jgi:uncharacterized protein
LIVENAFTVAAPMDVVFDTMRDVRTMLPCLDARVLEIVDGHTARGELTIPMGDNTMVFSGTLRVGEADREAGAITFEAVGRGAGEAAAQGRMSVRLRESAGATTVSVQADVEVADASLGVDADKTQRAARRLFARLGKEVAERISREEEPPVRGTVRMMAPPVPTHATVQRGLGATLTAQIRRHPWLLPAAVLGAVVLLLALRRHEAA